jgi:hypothetical protein
MPVRLTIMRGISRKTAVELLERMLSHLKALPWEVF